MAQVLAEARAFGAAPFVGYGSDDPDAPEQQVFALWYALEQRGLRYSPLTTRSSLRGRVFVQRVRSLHESLSDRAANCVDGSVLLASLLGAAGLDTALVRVPGHMFVRFALDAGGMRYAYLETTLLNDPRIAAGPQREAGGASGIDPVTAASQRRFAAALLSGEQQYRRALRELERGSSPQYRIIGIAEARRLGVHALPRLEPAQTVSAPVASGLR